MRVLQLIVFCLILVPCSGNFISDFFDNIFGTSDALTDLCQNNGTRVIEGTESWCQCENGWTGSHCGECQEGFVNDEICHTCDGVICLNGGNCTASINGTECLCDSGFFGDFCEFKSEADDATTLFATLDMNSTTASHGDLDVPSKESSEALLPTAVIRAHRPLVLVTPLETPSTDLPTTNTMLPEAVDDWVVPYWLIAVLLIVTIVVVALCIFAVRRHFIAKGDFTPALPQYKFKDLVRARSLPLLETPLHDALKFSMQPLETIPEDWVPLLQTVDTLGQTPIHAAVVAEAEKPESVILSDLQLLISATINIDQRDYAGNTALHLAIKHNRPEVVEFLLFLGADPNVYGTQRATPLSMAIAIDSLECFEKLVNHHKTDPNLAIESGDTALKMCIARGSAYYKFFDCLLSNPKTDVKAIGDIRTGNQQAPVHVAVLSNNVYAMKWLIKRQANLVAKDRDNKTPLLLAIENEAFEIAELLISVIDTHNFYDWNLSLSPFEQAKQRNFRNVLGWMKQAELASCKPRKSIGGPSASGATARKTENAQDDGYHSPNANTNSYSPTNAIYEESAPLMNMHSPYHQSRPSAYQQPFNGYQYCPSFTTSARYSPETSLEMSNFHQSHHEPSNKSYRS